MILWALAILFTWLITHVVRVTRDDRRNEGRCCWTEGKKRCPELATTLWSEKPRWVTPYCQTHRNLAGKRYEEKEAKRIASWRNK